MSAIGAVVELVEVQTFFLKMLPSLAERTARLLFGWLCQLDLRDTPVTIPGIDGRARWASDAWRQTIDKLRLMTMLLGSSAPDAQGLSHRDHERRRPSQDEGSAPIL